MLTIKKYSELLEILYAAPLQQEKWVQFLDALRDSSRSRGGYLICADSRLGLSIRAQGGGGVLDADVQEAYREIYAPKDPYRLAIIRSGKIGVLDCDALLPRAALVQTEMYRNIMAPAGLTYPALIVLHCSVRRFEAISFWRTAEEGPMNDDDVHLLQLLVPHIRTALELRQTLGVMNERLQGAEAMADASDTAAFVLTPLGEIFHRNKAAVALMQDTTCLRVDRNLLSASDSHVQQKLRNLLRAASSIHVGTNGAAPDHALSVDRGPGRQPLALVASPITRSDRWPARSILLLVHDPEQPMETPDALLREMYGLTAAEVELANGLLTGYSLEEISVLRKVSIGTTRIQLKSVFGKTQTRSQSELVRLLVRLPRTQ